MFYEYMLGSNIIVIFIIMFFFIKMCVYFVLEQEGMWSKRVSSKILMKKVHKIRIQLK